MDADLLKIMGSLALAAIYYTPKILLILKKPTPRQQLLADLEILDKTPESMVERETVVKHIQNHIQLIYRSEDYNNVRVIDWPNAVSLSVVTLFLVFLTIYFSKDGFSGWSLLAGVFSLGFLTDAIRSWQGAFGDKSSE